MKVLKIVQINYCIRGQKKNYKHIKTNLSQICCYVLSISSTTSIEMNIWEFSVHILLKPTLKNFEHYFASL